ncbi:MAG: hypothetical protein LBQ81_01355 [Zoogloeaceae bacterium]|nr:hypothetical protein [Zoogloeaceae bacterium]
MDGARDDTSGVAIVQNVIDVGMTLPPTFPGGDDISMYNRPRFPDAILSRSSGGQCNMTPPMFPPGSFPMRRVFTSPFLLSLLVALFLFGQAAAASHAFSHVQEDAAHAPDEVCVLCLAAAAFGSAAPMPVSPLLVLPVFQATAEVIEVPVRFSSPCRAYWGRAPPVLP